MTKDYYKILGVARGANDDDIKRAYRKLAMKHHPDRGGNQVEFQEIQEAYNILSDAQRRAEYDNPAAGMRININGQNVDPGSFDFDSIFNMFGARFNHPGQQMRQERVTLWIPLSDAVRGGRRLVSIGTMHGASTIELDVPEGVADGENIRYPKLSPSGGDLVVQYRLQPDAVWHRDGLDLFCEKTVDFWGLITGTEIEIVDILNNRFDLIIPARLNPGTVLRARGRGIARKGHATGDLLVKINAVMPAEIPDEIVEILTKIQANK
jgi:DnaJ-class molecular chaperone